MLVCLAVDTAQVVKKYPRGHTPTSGDRYEMHLERLILHAI
jgi:hypothetical protein